MTRVAALELGKFGIRVNAVCPEAGSPAMMAPYMPPGIDVEKIAAYQQRTLSYQRARSIGDRIRDIANTILFLASDESLSVTGTEILVDSGNAAGTIVKGTPGS
jgi:3-oxoacyl-[acyl-carrier protein] reductase